MKDINKVEAFNQMNVSRQLIHEKISELLSFGGNIGAYEKLLRPSRKASMKFACFHP